MAKKDDQKLIFSSDDKVITFETLLSEEQLALLKDRFSSKSSRQNPPAFQRRDLEFTLPLEPRHDKTRVQALRLRVISKNWKEGLKLLLWNAVYGRDTFTIFQWYILFNIFTRRIRKNSAMTALLLILRITTQQCGKAFNQKLRSVRTIVSFFLGKDLAIKYCQKIEKDLGVKLPTKGGNLKDYFAIEETTIKQKKPKEPNRIGVGYKDKGHLPDGPKVDPLPDESYSEEINDLFVDLLSETKEAVAFVESYDPKKRKKLLDQISKALNK